MTNLPTQEKTPYGLLQEQAEIDTALQPSGKGFYLHDLTYKIRSKNIWVIDSRVVIKEIDL